MGSKSFLFLLLLLLFIYNKKKEGYREKERGNNRKSQKGSVVRTSCVSRIK